MKNEKTIEVLNSLIIINNDRIEGYETASKETAENDLKILFAEFISISKQCNRELTREINKLGGKVIESREIAGKFFHVWMDVKAAIKNKDMEAIFNFCEYGEDKTQYAYNESLERQFKYLNIEQQIMIITQKSLLKSDRVNIRSRRNTLVETVSS